jgi:hypothetical protein
VTRQPFGQEASHCPDDGFKPFSNLVLHYGVEYRVSFHIREFDARNSMMCFAKVYTLLLVEREPCGRIRRDIGIVVPHNGPKWWLTYQLSGAPPR